MLENELYERYNTGVTYVSPAAIDYFDSKFRKSCYCEAEFGDLLRDYVEHLLFPPTNKCFNFPKSTDGVIRDGGMTMNGEEKEWVSVEYKMRNALNNFFKSAEINLFGLSPIKVKFIATYVEGDSRWK